MKKEFSIIRIAVTYVLGTAFFIALFGCPDESLPLGQKMITFILSKVIALLAFVGIIALWGGWGCVKAFFKGFVANDIEPKHANR